MMIARMISVEIQPGHEDDLVAAVEATILPVAREQDGFVNAVGLIDRSTGRGMLITFWADARHLEASEASGYLSAQLAHAAPFLTGPAIRETFEVAVAPAGAAA